MAARRLISAMPTGTELPDIHADIHGVAGAAPIVVDMAKKLQPAVPGAGEGDHGVVAERQAACRNPGFSTISWTLGPHPKASSSMACRDCRGQMACGPGSRRGSHWPLRLVRNGEGKVPEDPEDQRRASMASCMRRRIRLSIS